MHLFIEQGMKGGISYITKIFSKAIIEYMQSYDDKTSKYITYFNANNLYGWIMSQYLLYSGYKRLN